MSNIFSTLFHHIYYFDIQELSGEVLVLTDEDAAYYSELVANEEFHLAINENYVRPEPTEAELFPENQSYAVGEAIVEVFDPDDIIEYRVEDGYYEIDDPRYIITYDGQEHNMAAEDSFYSIGREDYEYEGIDNSDGIDALIGQFIENFGDPIIGIDENEDVTEYSWYIGPKKENILKLEYITTEDYGWYLTSFNTNTPH